MDPERPKTPTTVPKAGRRVARPLFRGRATAMQTAVVFLFLGTVAANIGPRLGAAADLSERQTDAIRQLSALRACIDHYRDRHGSYPDLSRSFDALLAGGESAPVLTAAPVNPISRSATVSTKATPGNGWLYGGSSGPEAGTIFALDAAGKTLDF
jgi:type II secretory pathway pseudopilin PulG